MAEVALSKQKCSLEGNAPVPVREAAKLLGVSPRTIYRYVKDGLIEYFRVGQAIRIPEKSLEQFHHKGTLNKYPTGKEAAMPRKQNRPGRYLKSKIKVHDREIRPGVWGIDYLIDGKRVRKTIGSEEEAREAAAKLQRQLNSKGQREQYLRRQEFTVTDLIEKYRLEKLPLLKTKTRIKYAKILDRFQAHCGRRSLNELNREDIKNFLASLPERCCKKTKKRVPLSEATWNDHRMIVQGILNWAIQEEILDVNPGATIRKMKVPKRELRCLTADEVRRLLNTVKGTRFEVVVAISVFAGTRLAETLALNWEDITFSRGGKVGMIAVTKSVNDGTTKNLKHRHIPLHSQLEALLEPHHKDNGPICLNTRGSRMSIENMQRDIKLIYRKAGISGANIHCWRHTFAFLHLHAGASLSKVGHWLGHADPKTTQIYAHWVRDDQTINNLVLDLGEDTENCH